MKSSLIPSSAVSMPFAPTQLLVGPFQFLSFSVLSSCALMVLCLVPAPMAGGAPGSSLVGVEPSAPVPEDTWASGPSLPTYDAFGTVPRSACVFLWAFVLGVAGLSVDVGECTFRNAMSISL